MTHLTVYHTNDMHNRRAMFPLLATLRRAPNSLLLDSGDAIGGSNTVFKFREPILAAMCEAGYDAMALGNREFHYLRGVIMRRHRQVNFPFLCANVEDTRHRVSHILRRSVLKDVAGLRVALTGFTPVQYHDHSIWRRLSGFRFLDPIETARTLVPALRKQADVVIVLSHLGYAMDRELAGEVPGMTLIIGGHSHTTLEEPVAVGETHIVQTGCFGRHLGCVELKVAKRQGVVSVAGRLIPTERVYPAMF